ncbi:hypothetical protein LINGRAHAP2_LOCUS7321 [Linum grandiflorum]
MNHECQLSIVCLNEARGIRNLNNFHPVLQINQSLPACFIIFLITCTVALVTVELTPQNFFLD